MSKIYIVSHPHNEPSYGWKRPRTRMTIGWNTTKIHRRKFIKRKGLYLCGSTECEADIYFWGEYEAGSQCTIVSNSRPKAVHDVLTPGRGVSPLPPDAQNTDPYVFGDHFKHICCGMKWTGGDYESGDVILFGRAYVENNIHRMALDTVFVVKDKVPVDFTRTLTQYYKVGIEPTNKDVFYRGTPYCNDTQYFSFVPCKLEYSHDPLPVLDLDGMGFRVTKRFRTWTTKPIPLTNTIWSSIIKTVQNAGWELGIHVDKV